MEYSLGCCYRIKEKEGTPSRDMSFTNLIQKKDCFLKKKSKSLPRMLIIGKVLRSLCNILAVAQYCQIIQIKAFSMWGGGAWFELFNHMLKVLFSDI